MVFSFHQSETLLLKEVNACVPLPSVQDVWHCPFWTSQRSCVLFSVSVRTLHPPATFLIWVQYQNVSNYAQLIRTVQCVISVLMCEDIFPNMFHYTHCLLFLIVLCPPLHVENGRAEDNTSFFTAPFDRRVRGYSIGTMVSFSCNEHNITEGSSSAICQYSQTWSEEPPICNACNENENICICTFFLM